MKSIGIDLGTTHSLAAHWTPNGPELIHNALGKTLTPSVVSVLENGEFVVGEAARDRLQTHPALTASLFKRAMGTQKVFKLGKRSLRAEELSALVLRTLKRDAEEALGESIESAVVTVPAYFNDTQRKATRIAGQLAGLRVDRLINEPTAASIAYGLHDKPEFSTVTVLDIGGGTFDVSVLEMFDGVMQIHSSAGDNQLGGEDFNQLLATHVLSTQETEVSFDSLSPAEQAGFSKEIERAKIQLSSEQSTTVDWKGAKIHLNTEVSRATFEALTEPLLKRMSAPVERALRDANISTSALDGLVLVGGASRMPVVRSLSARLLGKLPFMQVNPDEVVALGAAIQVGLIQGSTELDEIVLTDVAPYSLGVGTEHPGASDEDDLLFSPIIERNTPIPASRSGIYGTVYDYQNMVRFRVYQGESRRTLENVELGELLIKVPAEKQGKEQVDVRFTYDISGLLEVQATVLSTKKTHSVVLQREESLLSESEIKDRLKNLATFKQHPRDQSENIAVIARAERLYEEFIGDYREAIAQSLHTLEQTMELQDPQKITKAREDIERLLDELEGQ